MAQKKPIYYESGLQRVLHDGDTLRQLQDPSDPTDLANKAYVDEDPIIVGVTIDGGGSSPATGSKGYAQVGIGGAIIGWTLLADVSGSAQITVKKGAFGSFPATSSIVGSAPPALSSQQGATSSTLTGWTTAVNAGDVFEFNLDSISTITRLTLELQIQRG